MRRLLIVAAIALTLATCKAGRAETANDKILHATTSYALTTATFGLYKAVLTRNCRLGFPRPKACPLSSQERLGAAVFAAATSMAIGVLKEFGDRQIDGGDLLANGVGNLTAIATVIVFEF